MDFTGTSLGIELGSTRIKAVLIDEKHIPIASGDFEWENQFVNGIWTYHMEAVHNGIRACFEHLQAAVTEKFGVYLHNVGAIGVSAMMHVYLHFDKDGNQLAEFRTWRNTITGPAAEKLTELFGFNIPHAGEQVFDVLRPEIIEYACREEHSAAGSVHRNRKPAEDDRDHPKCNRQHSSQRAAWQQ